ncbi:MAG: hypothetical protein KGN78_11150 [Actinomycetales bacterium]|nr:hypothetical protein [Actinomycetales bacterium]
MQTYRCMHGQTLLAVLLSGIDDPVTSDSTEFLTEDDAQFQLGVITRLADSEIVPHVHHPIERHVVGTCEALLVACGSVDVDIYGPDKSFVESMHASSGDVIVFMGVGGHGFRFSEGCRLIEIKQGPYVEGIDKEKFHRGEGGA